MRLCMSELSRRDRQGSALIITILIVSVISSISFMVSALAISEFRKAGTLQDSIAAYYAAESGIEQGLLQYRLWHDAELSEETTQSAVTNTARVSPTETVGTPQKVPLAANSSSTYAVKMWFKGSAIGTVDTSGKPVVGAVSRQIVRDSALQIAGLGAKRLQLAWQAINPNTVARPGFDAKYFVEVIATGLKGGQQQTERTVIKDLDKGTQPYPVVFGLDTVQTIRVKPWDMSAVKYSLTLQDSSGKNILFDNQVSYIESTGTVGRAKRTLKIGIDRASGTGLESQDFVLYSGDNPILLQ